MTRVPIHDPSSAPEASRATLERLAAGTGKVLNIHGAMAASPLVLELYDSMENLLRSRSSLGEPVRQAIHLAVATVNECDYCQAAYTGAALHAGFSLEETVDIRRGELPGRDDLNALLAVVRQVAGDKGYVSDSVWDAALAAGWSQEQLLEAYADVVRTILTNYFNHMTGIELDLRPAPPIT